MENPSFKTGDAPLEIGSPSGGGSKSPVPFAEIARFSWRILLDNLGLFLPFVLVCLVLFWVPYTLALRFFSGDGLGMATAASSMFSFFFIGPVILLAQCQLVLRVWDGESIGGLSVFQWAFSQYFHGLVIVLCGFFYNLGLSIMLLFIFFPALFVYETLRLSLGGGPAGAAAVLAACALAFFLIKAFVWQRARRILTLLAPLNGFACAEGFRGDWWSAFSHTYRNLDAPDLAVFLNQFLATILILETLRICFYLFLGLGGEYSWVHISLNLILDIVMVLAGLWLRLIAAGFYRFNYRREAALENPDSQQP